MIDNIFLEIISFLIIFVFNYVWYEMLVFVLLYMYVVNMLGF